MMDLNNLLLSGNVSRAGINELKFGPMGWFRLAIQQNKVGSVVIPQHEIFVGMDLKAPSDDKVERNKKKFQAIQDGGFVTLWDCLIDSYTKHGETKVNRRVKAKINSHMITKEVGVPVNLCSFVGKVTKFLVHQGNGWAELQCSYINPKAEKGTPWPTRSVKVLVPGEANQLRVGHQYFVAGKLSGKDLADSEDLIVIASIVQGA